jgi:predicted dehydrogenase/threonine dehydrogenase-like Zn-dependent dehydrogenase
MQQLSQKLKNGIMKIIEVPYPTLTAGTILVRNHYSLISTGTETSTVKTAQKGLIGKAKERPQQVKQVLDVLKQQGPVQTYRAVMKKLDAFSPLGYSCAGEVIDTAPDVSAFKIGDLVACGGLSASHAEVVSVPVNLAVKLADDTDLKQATYNTLGSIAMQGVRQADLRLGETCAVIGLGLLGQLTALLLQASGIRTIGVDIDQAMVDVSTKNGLDLGLNRKTGGIEEVIMGFTGGIGCDAVIITAASESLDPINFAGAISRKRGTIVVVGAVPTGFEREPHFYKKELQLKMSCSYGPGRYDPSYEEKGIDYPAAYVRWTENRNMQAFQDLIHTKKIDISHLTTHIFKLEDAPAAYEMILRRSEAFIGILIEYDTTRKIENTPIYSSTVNTQTSSPSDLSIGFIGAGSYAQSHLLPNLPQTKKIALKGVMTTTGTSARSVAERYGFDFCTTDEKEIILNDDINTVFIATRHDSHSHYVLEALKAGKHVFIEKPLCLTIDKLEAIKNAYDLSAMDHQPVMMVGYNRRFAPLIIRLKKEIGGGPMAITYRVNAGNIPADSWIQDKDFGGGRIIGEVCHFVDTLSFLCGALPVSVHANAMSDPDNLQDTLNVNLAFQNGSIASISYFANGDKRLAKERIEVFAHGVSAIIDDFREMIVYSRGKKTRKKLMSQDKGQQEEVKQFVAAVLEGKGNPIPVETIYNTSIVTFAIIESIRTGDSLNV